ncbi:MAG TPA: T9SS type A sorting domain-containing protein [Chitinophagales bacterium]|nr:T9SS type A sorting domain-containing protein [Chitinophagales bacterium]
MPKTLFTLAVYLAFGYLQANNIYDSNTLIKKLTYVNAQWNNQPEAKQLTATVQITDNTTYKQWIATHLMLVEQTLRARTASTLTAIQKQNRANLLNELHGYWQAGIFPINDYLNYKNPVFIDRRGTHCAVGYLMMQSGHDDLAQAIDRNEKFAYVHQIKTGGVKEWADAYGFTIDELAWIQPSYLPTTKFAELGDGPNGPVDIFHSNVFQLIFAGRFDSLNNLPCLNIGRYENGQLECLGGGIDGIITGAITRNGVTTVAGSFKSGDTTYPVAYYNGTWNYLSIPGRENAYALCAVSGFYSVYEVVIASPIYPGAKEIWQYNGNWQQNAIVYGDINSIEMGENYGVYAGVFDSITFMAGSTTNTITAHNVLIKNRYTDQFFSIAAEVSDTIKVTKTIGKAIYLGGVCSSDSGRSNICLTRYLNGVLQPLIFHYPYYDGLQEITALEEYESNLLVGGQFEYDYMTRFKNLATIDAVSGYWGAIGFINGSVNALKYLDGQMYLGGNFTKYSNVRPLQYLAKIDVATSLGFLNSKNQLQLYPNPTQSTITFSTGDNGELLQAIVSDLTGREVIRQSGIEVSNSISVEHLPPGIYILKALTQNGTGSARFVKN